MNNFPLSLPLSASVSPILYHHLPPTRHFPSASLSSSFVTRSIPPLLLPLCKDDGRNSFRCSAVVCHDVIAVATRQTVSRYTQMHQAPDPSPNTHIQPHTNVGALSFLRPLKAPHFIRNTNAWSQITHIFLRTHTHTHTPKRLLVYATLSLSYCCPLLQSIVSVFKRQLYVCL